MLRQIAANVPSETEAALDQFDFRTPLMSLWSLVTAANRYVEESAPWVLAKRAKDGNATAAQRLDTVMYNLAESLRLIAFHLTPYLPAAAVQIARQIGVENHSVYEAAVAWGRLAPGIAVSKPHALFPRVELATSEGTEGMNMRRNCADVFADGDAGGVR